MSTFDILSKPFEICGLAVREEGKLWRVPEDIIDRVNDRVSRQGRWTSGAGVRFRTDADKIKVRVWNHMPRAMEKANMISGHGVDVYFDGRFAGPIYPKTADEVYEGEIPVPWYLEGPKTRDVRIYFPISDGIKRMEIELPDGASLLPPTPFSVPEQVVFYGSSITMGLYASRPGMHYIAQLSRALDFKPYCLGFGSGAHGELLMADYIASLPMRVFVLDYDHNDGAADLAVRHEPFFKRVRDKNPDLPIIMITRPDFERHRENAEAREVVRRTYENAKAAGDGHVWFIDGESFYGKTERDLYTLDCVHPNDMGMTAMARGILPVLREALADAVETEKKK